VGQKKYDQAVKTLATASRKDAKNEKVWYGICDAYYHKGFFTAAIGPCEKTVKLNPDFDDALNRLAWLYARKSKKLDKGLEYSQRALNKDPNNPEFLSTLAEIHHARGDSDLATAAIQSAIDLDPDEKVYQEQLQKFKRAQPASR